MADLLLRGGLVLTADGPVGMDVRVSKGVVAEVGRDLVEGDSTLLDCAGSWIGPGFVDLHTHMREPGEEWKEDITSGSEAAAAGGYVALVAMPNTVPPTDSGHLARYVRDRAAEVGLVEVVPAGAITLGLEGEKLAHLDELLAAGVTIFTDDGRPVSDSGLMRRAMEYLAHEDATVAQHAEDEGLSRGGQMHEGSLSSRLGVEGVPGLAEEIMIARDLALVRLTGARYHVLHASTRATVELVRGAKAEDLPVTAETSPHHLLFDVSEVESMDPMFKMYPPLRRPEDVQALRAGVSDGTIDAIATDHAPHAAHEKEKPFEEAPRGVIGLETAASATMSALDTDPATLFDKLSVAPARLAGLNDFGQLVSLGIPAHLVVFDPKARYVPTEFVSRSANSPFVGYELTGVVRSTVFGGRLTWHEGKVVR